VHDDFEQLTVTRGSSSGSGRSGRAAARAAAVENLQRLKQQRGLLDAGEIAAEFGITRWTVLTRAKALGGLGEEYSCNGRVRLFTEEEKTEIGACIGQGGAWARVTENLARVKQERGLVDAGEAAADVGIDRGYVLQLAKQLGVGEMHLGVWLFTEEEKQAIAGTLKRETLHTSCVDCGASIYNAKRCRPCQRERDSERLREQNTRTLFLAKVAEQRPPGSLTLEDLAQRVDRSPNYIGELAHHLERGQKIGDVWWFSPQDADAIEQHVLEHERDGYAHWHMLRTGSTAKIGRRAAKIAAARGKKAGRPLQLSDDEQAEIIRRLEAGESIRRTAEQVGVGKRQVEWLRRHRAAIT
jgi:Helix-turn-helix domain of resolvase